MWYIAVNKLFQKWVQFQILIIQLLWLLSCRRRCCVVVVAFSRLLCSNVPFNFHLSIPFKSHFGMLRGRGFIFPQSLFIEHSYRIPLNYSSFVSLHLHIIERLLESSMLLIKSSFYDPFYDLDPLLWSILYALVRAIPPSVMSYVIND